jgi:hypothetical protein
MLNDWSRRGLLKLAAFAVPFGRIGFLRLTAAGESSDHNGSLDAEPVPDLFPTQSPELAREMVTVSHFDLKRVQELAETHPSLARASWDWGFGDWESALGASSHMVNKPIPGYLISRGARPSLFSAAMLGQLEVVKAMIAANSGAQRIRGPHGIGLLAHAKAGGEQARSVFEFLQTLGDADAVPSAPLSDQEITGLVGTYIFGYGESQRIEVTAEDRKGFMSMYSLLTWTRRGMMGRPVVHVGERSFYPAGAPSGSNQLCRRIRFSGDDHS